MQEKNHRIQGIDKEISWNKCKLFEIRQFGKLFDYFIDEYSIYS